MTCSLDVGMFAQVRCLADRHSRWLVVGRRKAYPSDLTDEQWEVVGPFLAAWKAKHPSVSGHQGRHDLREIVNAISTRTGRRVSGRTCRTTCHRNRRRTTTSRCGVTMAPTSRSTTCCAAKPGRGPAAPRSRPRSCWTPGRSARPTTSPPPRPEKMRRIIRGGVLCRAGSNRRCSSAPRLGDFAA